MGLFNKMFKKDKEIEFLMPLEGEVINISDIPDPVFSEKMMGDGFGIKPKGNEVFSPIKGEVASIFPTNHAIGIKNDEGIEVLIHVGIDTVNLKGEGFESKVKVGDKIEAGDLLLVVDFEAIKDRVPSIITPIIFTAIEGFEYKITNGDYKAKDAGVVSISK